MKCGGIRGAAISDQPSLTHRCRALIAVSPSTRPCPLHPTTPPLLLHFHTIPPPSPPLSSPPLLLTTHTTPRVWQFFSIPAGHINICSLTSSGRIPKHADIRSGSGIFSSLPSSITVLFHFSSRCRVANFTLPPSGTHTLAALCKSAGEYSVLCFNSVQPCRDSDHRRCF